MCIRFLKELPQYTNRHHLTWETEVDNVRNESKGSILVLVEKHLNSVSFNENILFIVKTILFLTIQERHCRALPEL